MDSAASSNGRRQARTGTARVKRGMAEMLKGGVIMDVVTPEQARIAEGAGAVAVMALERVPADIRAQGGVSRMSDPDMIEGIISAVTIPVMAKARIGHFVEAQILQSLGVDYIDESEVLTPADYTHHIDKWKFTVPFVCGATNLGEALRRINEGAAMIRSKGEAGTGDVSNATTHMRAIGGEIRRLGSLSDDELYVAAKELAAPYELVVEVARAGKLPVTLFTAGGIATPADAAMMMQLGAEGVFVGSGIFKSGDPAQRAAAIVKATTFYDDPDVLAKVSRGLGEAMVGINVEQIAGAASPRRSAAGKNSPCRSKRSLISSNSRSTSTAAACSAPNQGNWQRTFGGQVAGQSLVSAVRTVDPHFLVHSLHGYFIRPGDSVGANDFHRRAAARRWIVLHPAGQRHPARPNDLLHVGVVSDRSGGHPPPGRDALSAAAGRSAGTEVDEGVRRRRVQAVPGVGHPHRAARSTAPATRQGRPAAGVVPAPRSAARRPGAAHLRAGLHERSHPAGVGTGHPSRRARAPASGLTRPCDVVHAGVPRRRVAALRPVLAVGVRRPGAVPGQDLQSVRRDGRRRHAGGADSLPA